jgi:hypothetical protein
VANARHRPARREGGRGFFRYQRFWQDSQSNQQGPVSAETISEHSESKLGVHGRLEEPRCAHTVVQMVAGLEKVLTRWANAQPILIWSANNNLVRPAH